MLRRLVAAARCGLRPHAFRDDKHGASAVEFAILAPVLMTLAGGVTDLSGAITAANRATYVAEGIGQIVSQVKAPITQTTMQAFLRSAPLFDPDVMTFARDAGITNADKAVNVVISSIVFDPTVAGCVSNCLYTAHVVFSASLSDWPKRACGILGMGTADLAKLPMEAFGPSSLVVVDVETFYRPLMTMFLSQQLSFKRTAFFRPRQVGHVNYEQNCTGYPVN